MVRQRLSTLWNVVRSLDPQLDSLGRHLLWPSQGTGDRAQRCAGALDQPTVDKHAWAWASAVLVGAGIAYPGEAAGFWLYGGTLDIHSERVVSVLRGVFFEAILPARQHMAAQGAACPETVMADMMRERVTAEARLDVFYVREAFERSYDAREKKAGRPETGAAVRA